MSFLTGQICVVKFTFSLMIWQIYAGKFELNLAHQIWTKFGRKFDTFWQNLEQIYAGKFGSKFKTFCEVATLNLQILKLHAKSNLSSLCADTKRSKNILFSTACTQGFTTLKAGKFYKLFKFGALRQICTGKFGSKFDIFSKTQNLPAQKANL